MTNNRFQSLDVNDFIKDKENKNTLKKTACHMRLLDAFLLEKFDENRPIHTIPPSKLDEYLSNFIINVRSKDDDEYEPSTLRGMIGSFERHLKRHRYGFHIMSTSCPEFATTRNALRAKQKDLKSIGKGSKPMKADPLDNCDIEKLFETNQLGNKNPNSLINTLWYFNTLHFGMRGGSAEHREMRLGDVLLKKDDRLQTEYLEYYERQTKTRPGDDVTNTRACPPRMYANPENRSRCPVFMYKFYESKRPVDYCNENDPFYIATVTNDMNPGVKERWFLRGPIGKNKIDGIMKKMAIAANLPANKRFTNTSVRKTLVQTMTDHQVPDNLQVYVTGHKNAQSLNNYRTLSDTHKYAISNILSNPSKTINTPKSTPLPSCTLSIAPPDEVNPLESNTCAVEQPANLGQPRVAQFKAPQHQHLFQQRWTNPSVFNRAGSHQLESVFAGSSLKDCNISVNINYNSISNSNSAPKRKRVIYDTDSD